MGASVRHDVGDAEWRLVRPPRWLCRDAVDRPRPCRRAEGVNRPHDSLRSGLLGKRRFLPLFVTQFLGAFNDNLFKTAMVILVTYHGL